MRPTNAPFSLLFVHQVFKEYPYNSTNKLSKRRAKRGAKFFAIFSTESSILCFLKNVPFWSVLAKDEICDFFASPAQNVRLYATLCDRVWNMRLYAPLWTLQTKTMQQAQCWTQMVNIGSTCQQLFCNAFPIWRKGESINRPNAAGSASQLDVSCEVWE